MECCGLYLSRATVSTILATTSQPMMSEAEMRVLIKSAKAQAGTWRALAKEYGVTPAYLHAMVSGSKPVTDDIARRLGYRRVRHVTFEPLRETS